MCACEIMFSCVCVQCAMIVTLVKKKKKAVWYLPKLRSECRRCGEVSELSSYAVEEEASQTLAIDCRDAGWC